jgi:DNA-binding response OmpR family regulator
MRQFVDDERSMVRLLEQLLAHAGYKNLRGTIEPREVLQLCDELQPDLIMLDLRMPHVDGIEVLRQLKRRRAETYLPVLVLTADVTRESKRASLEAGASDFVTKPFEQTELLLRVRNLIDMRFLHRDLRRQNETLEVQIQARTHQLLEAEKLATTGNLLAGVAHELNSRCRSSSARSGSSCGAAPIQTPALASRTSARPRSDACGSSGAF